MTKYQETELTKPDSRTLEVHSADEFRELLPTSGVFDMLDCEVELVCPPSAQTEEVEKMVTVIESMINVTDVRVIGVPRSEDEETYLITITDVPFQVAKGRNKR